ncbi:Bestrophin [Teladorsagia circumcincta]|uniref:Bestrophin homolog n=1 Tax=Teladorsagia circumcincta TaxID=45464 RepID=A0A2G9UG51_TELCI|nr:Bestrophin [Teladorsagia circumcincta]
MQKKRKDSFKLISFELETKVSCMCPVKHNNEALGSACGACLFGAEKRKDSFNDDQFCAGDEGFMIVSGKAQPRSTWMLVELPRLHIAQGSMTVSYSGNFVRLLLRWKGSIWRSVWMELVAFLLLFYAVRLFYNYAIPAIDPGEELELKWWSQFECLSWPEDLLSIVCLILPDNTEDSRKKRHQIARYVNLVAAIAWRDVSDKIRLRFPAIHDLVDAGLMTESEFIRLEKLESPSPGVRWIAPLIWIQQLITAEVESGRATTNYLSVFANEMKQYRTSFRKLFCHDWVCIPLVYTQVASLATYSFFVFCLFGRQHFDPEHGFDTVGQDLMRPFGLDDDDIELSYILDRNLEDVYWRHLQHACNLPKDSELKFGRIDLSRAAHKHPPKLHTYIEVPREEKTLMADKLSEEQPQRCDENDAKKGKLGGSGTRYLFHPLDIRRDAGVDA